MTRAVDVRQLEAVGAAAGLDALGVAPAEPFEGTRRDLVVRKAAGLAATMAFTYRNPDRSTDPQRLLPGARSLVVGALGYRRAPVPRPGAVAGRVARYAWDDHYGTLRRALAVVAAELRAAGWRTALAVDENSLVDREAAYRAGIGWYGKSSNLLLPGRGSWFVLGSVATDAPLPPDRPQADGCGSCRRCLDGCPTGAIVAPGVVDARRCLAWLVQAPGTFPSDQRVALGDRIYGCDDCQEVCPPNRRDERSHPAPPPAADAQPWVALVDLLTSSDDELLRRHGRWYIPGREPRWLRRNALVALGNTATAAGDPEVVDCLRDHLTGADAMLRAHAVWAARRLGLDELVTALVGDDPDPAVREELSRPVPARDEASSRPVSVRARAGARA